MRRALITGISGQDGAYLAKLLLDKGYEVIGAQRHGATPSLWRLEELGIADRIRLVPLELLEFSNVMRTVEAVRPDEIYNLAAISYVAPTFDQPIYTGDVNGLGAVRLLEAIRTVNPAIRFYQASTSEMFGKVRETPQRETTPFYPRSPYAAAKLYAHVMTVNYREAHGLHASNGILFNHESPLRGEEFVTRKITRGLADIMRGGLDCLRLGNLDARRDWGFAGDYVRGMWAMIQQDEADDYVLATGETHTIREFVDAAARAAGVELEWRGQDMDETAVERQTGSLIVKVEPSFYRPAEVDALQGDAAKARRVFGWQPTFAMEALANMMMTAELARGGMKVAA